MDSQALLILAAVAAGISSSLIGVAYRLGQGRGMPTAAVLALVALAGTVVFAVRVPADQWPRLPPSLWLLALAAGLSQYGGVLLIAALLRRGSMTAMWCAVNLGFPVSIAYARLFLAEPVRLPHVVATAAAVGCVLAAAQARKPAQAGAKIAGSKAAYGLLFVSLLLANTIMPTGMKHLNASPLECELTVQAQLDAYAALAYAVMCACSVIHVVGRHRLAGWGWWWLAAGALAAVGSVLCTRLIAIFTRLPAAVGFTTCSACSILSAALFGAMLFGERRTRAWYATVILALAAVGLVGLAR
jgi:drug/metabolite transporter (DMT)-like permease